MNSAITSRRSTAIHTFLLVIIFLVGTCAAEAQRYIDRSGKASFFSSAPLEDIEANSEQVVAILDIGSGEIAASMLMRSFNFRKSLMEEHFNENYVESHTYPKATFKGKITNLAAFASKEDGNYTLNIDGEVTLHGVTKPLQVQADARVAQGRIHAQTKFPLTVADFGIKVPRLVTNNIAEVVEVSVSFNFQPMN